MPPLTVSLLEAPVSDDVMEREPLAHAEAHDAVLDIDYAFVAYKETHRASGAWCVRIKSLDSGAAYFHPNAIRLQARGAWAERRSRFIWSTVVSPKAGDPRHIEFRVHVRDSEAVAVEIMLRLRKIDHTADEPVSVTFPWPDA